MMSPDYLRSVAKSYTHRTAVSVDGFAMRHFMLLSDAGLEVLSGIIELMEATSELPRQLDVVLLAMLPKPAGGYRPIGVFPGLYRLWGKARRPYCKEWELKHHRSYFGCGEAAGAVDLVWRQCFRSEAATSSGKHAATLLWDLVKFYESFNLQLLEERGIRLGFPPALLYLALRAYRAPRFVTINGYADGPFYARKGLTAGCSLATTFVRIYCIEAYDKIPITPSQQFFNFIDDDSVACAGSLREVVRGITSTADLLEGLITKELQSSISPAKAGLVASSAGLDRLLRKRLGGLAGDPQVEQSNLGIADCAARRGKAPGRSVKAKQRARVLAQKSRRLRRLMGAIGTKVASRVVKAGPVPGFAYGAEVLGLADEQAHRLHRSIGAHMGPKAAGRSLRAVLILADDPSWRSCYSPILQYARELWTRATCRFAGAIRWGEFRHSWHDIFVRQPPTKWSQVRGPMSAMYLSLQRLHWTMLNPYTFVTDKGGM